MDDKRELSDATDDDIERAVRGMVEEEPSSGLFANVMREVAAAKSPRGNRARDLQWRLALATASVLVLAAALWLGVLGRSARPPVWARGDRGVTSEQGRHAATRRDKGTTAASDRGIGSKPPAETEAHGSIASSLTGRHTVATPVAGPASHRAVRAARRTPTPALPSAAGNDVGLLLSPIEPLPDVPPLHIAPLADPAPVVIAPVVVAPIDIPDIQITPVVDQDDANRNPSSAPRTNDKRPAGPSSASRH